jgi:hypothetical protein
MLRSEFGRPLNITTATTTVVKGGVGVCVAVILNETNAGAITIYDNTAGSGTKIATIAAGALAGTTFPYLCQFSTGLTVVTAGADDITVTFS